MAHPHDHDHDGDDYFGATERTPLVGNASSAANNTPPASRRRPLAHLRGASIASIASSLKVPTAHKPSTIILILAANIFFAASSGALQQMAATRIFEDVFCRQYYADKTEFQLGDPIDERMCKEDEIQSRLAFLFAVSISIDAIVGCLSALPWGAAADRIGRKTVLVFCLAGFTMQIMWMMVVGWFSDTIPAEFYWLSSLTLLCGGGNAAAGACIGSMVSDILPELERSVAFMQIHVASSVGNLLAPAIASIMMVSLGPWPVMFVSLAVMATCSVTVLFVPETLQSKAQPDDAGALTLQDHAAQAVQELRNLLAIMKDPTICVVLAVFLLSLPPYLSTYQFLLQFVSKRYHIPIAETGFVQSTYGIAHIVVVLAFLPWLTKFVLRPSTPRFLRIENKHKRDLVLGRWSYAMTIVGSLILAVSPNLTGFTAGLLVMSFGAGADSMIKSTASALVAPDQTSRLFSLMAVMGIGSMLWTSPMLAGLFSLGMHLDGRNGGSGPWIGLPYLGVAASTTLMLVLVCFVRAPSERKASTVEAGEEGVDVQTSSSSNSENEQRS
ncbi:major facilitator superfamily transporter [Microdochium trichocladiopsis]|uniref:Major facilitator superfamily transporter n=1 Tax=Microdochium trichocladiopsis TaxID=1682393 RepID=A0A9P8Y2H1_9PEZI|nr:major facilitator superfamily transporter [Microdochium trichocladiopsis]KAH7029234.1 major facilitator superfamily transporter [Microdochium trichocladiopsis]